MPTLPERVPLNTFIASLTGDEATKIDKAAAIMMSNEKTAAGLRGVEAELRPFFMTAILSFLVGLALLVFFSEPGGFLDHVSGAWPIMTASLGFLPAMLTYYAIRIRRRSQADVHNFDLNKEYFLPHGAIYFPSDSASGEQMVTLVEVKAPPIGRQSKYDKLKPGAIW